MKPIHFRFLISDFRCSGGWLAVLLLLTAFVRVALATDPIYINSGNNNYFMPGSLGTQPPNIDATAFDNENVFSVSYNIFVNNQVEFSEPWQNTRFFTNNGTITVNAPIPTNSLFNFSTSFLTTGVGYEFDTLAGNSNAMAGTFFNPGTIHCDSMLDGNNLISFSFLGQLAGTLLIQTGIGECVVAATNILNPGNVVVSPNGLMKFTGQTVDFSRGNLTMEGAGANVAGLGEFGLNTNFWDPSASLSATAAQSAFIPGVGYLTLQSSTPYFEQPFQRLGPSNVIIRAVFIQDTGSSNVIHNVYFGANAVGPGDTTIEWISKYLDVASGQTFSNYLYLNNDYTNGASTNVLLNVDGLPDNFVFLQSATAMYGGAPASPGFQNVFFVGGVTNRYSYANGQFNSSTVTTNVSNRNPSGALTNLPGRLQITANQDLDLTDVGITGPNYMSLRATNQFEGSTGAHIVVPFADINVGVTNGFLTISNLMQPVIPNWSGTVQAWNTRWLAVANGVTNDFRVLIVGSQLNATTLAYVQDLILHGTNSLVLTDEMNVLRTLSIDAQNLTVTTNGAGNGATSLDGELNLFPPILWSSATPNLWNLTNYGAIRISSGGIAQFGSGTPTYVTNSVSTVAATATLSELASRTNVMASDKVTIGTNTYTFVTKLTNTAPSQVKIAALFDGTLSNLVAAINHAAGAGTNYSTNTPANLKVTAGLVSSHAFAITAITPGSAGNSIVTTTTSTNLTWTGSTLAGGVAGSTNVVTVSSGYYGGWINHGIVTDFGAVVYATNFESDGVISNGALGGFTLQAVTATFTNGSLYAGGNIALTASSLVVSNVALQAGRSLTLQVTNLLTDGVTNNDYGLTNGNVWLVQNTNSAGGNGLIMPVKPLLGDLLGTTISNYAAGPNKQVNNTWAGQDRGVSVNGYTNNVAVGRLVLDAVGASSLFYFSGVAVTNAMYVDDLEFMDAATNTDNNGNITAAGFNPNLNLVIYYAKAVLGGVPFSSKLNHKNGNHFRWVPTYAGIFSSTNLVYPAGVTNVLNAGLVSDPFLDSNGNGTPNGSDPNPIFVPAQVALTSIYTNNSQPAKVRLQWHSIPAATNYLQYTTNLLSPNWQVLTNFISPTNVPPVTGWPLTNLVYVTNSPVPQKYYRVHVDPNTLNLYGP